MLEFQCHLGKRKMVELMNKRVKVYIKINENKNHYYFGKVVEKDDSFLTIYDNATDNFRMLNLRDITNIEIMN